MLCNFIIIMFFIKQKNIYIIGNQSKASFSRLIITSYFLVHDLCSLGIRRFRRKNSEWSPFTEPDYVIIQAYRSISIGIYKTLRHWDIITSISIRFVSLQSFWTLYFAYSEKTVFLAFKYQSCENIVYPTRLNKCSAMYISYEMNTKRKIVILFSRRLKCVSQWKPCLL